MAADVRYKVLSREQVMYGPAFDGVRGSVQEGLEGWRLVTAYPILDGKTIEYVFVKEE